MAYGLIRGVAIDEEKKDAKLMESVIETIGLCFDFPDDNVQLQIIKVRIFFFFVLPRQYTSEDSGLFQSILF